MKESLRVALLGGGKMAIQHASAVRISARAQLVAVVDPLLPRDVLRERFGTGVELFSDLREMLMAAKPDVVHIATPPDTHASLAIACLQAGSHVYVEKPFALSADDAQSILALADARGLQVCAAHQVLFQRSATELRRALPAIGRVVHVESFFSFKPVRRGPGGGGLRSPVEQLIDILPHPVYLLLDAMPAGIGGVPDVTALDVDPEGEVRAVVRRGGARGSLVVSLQARPVESHLRVMGTNGSVKADFVLGGVIRHLGPGASAVAAVIQPFSSAWQLTWSSAVGLWRLLFRKHKSYPGLSELLDRFYVSIQSGKKPPIGKDEILETVRLCEVISRRLHEADQEEEDRLTEELHESESCRPVGPNRGTILVTGGSGTLGRPTVMMLQHKGWKVRVPARRALRARERLPGIEYVVCDLSSEVPDRVLDGVDLVVHAAAETAGDKSDHERNTIHATRNLLDGMKRMGVERLINIGSVAVLKPTVAGRPLREDSPVDLDNIGRGPYVWAKAAAEQIAIERARQGEIRVKTVRLGPLVDYDKFVAPGRLGREVGRLFVAMGRPSGRLSVCATATAAAVIADYAERFDDAPDCLNLTEAPPPTRGQLVERLRVVRPDLVFIWMPFPVLWVLSFALKGMMKLLGAGSRPLDVYAAFKPERYDHSAAERVIANARRV